MIIIIIQQYYMLFKNILKAVNLNFFGRIVFLRVDLPRKQQKKIQQKTIFFDYTPLYEHHLLAYSWSYLTK